MEIYDSIKHIIDVNVFSCLIPLLLILILIEYFFKNRFKTKQVINLVRWFLISYFFIGIVHNIIGHIFFSEEFSFTNRATGPYYWSFWLMFAAAVLFPFTLFYKKLATKPLYLIAIVFFMKIGWYFERFVIIVTSFHREYSPQITNFDSILFWIVVVLMHMLQAFIIAVILLGAFEIIERRKQNSTNYTSI